jgi:Fic family protein
MRNFISGKKIKQSDYKSFQPNFINREWIVDNNEVISLLNEANQWLGRLDMFSNYVPNIDLYISMHVIKEATQSSKIEGTQTKIEEALMDRSEISEEKRNDWEEVQNYIRALHSSLEILKKLPFSSRLIKETHKILLSGVRGKHKLPGEFRRSQNWIGGASIKDAKFIPPEFNTINDLMSDLEKFVHYNEYNVSELLKIAIVHYQFETIHPFLDGNGRVGRLMIPILLINEKILKRPILYISDFFEKHRRLYYDNLTEVREANDITQWCKFFLVAIIETAKKGVETFDQLIKLKKQTDEKLNSLKLRSDRIYKIMDYLYKNPLVNTSIVMEITGSSREMAISNMKKLEKVGVLKLSSTNKKNKQYVFAEYLDLFTD